MSQKTAIGQHFRHRAGAAMGMLGFCTSWAVSQHGQGPEWLQVVALDLPLPHLPEAWRGRRIVHLSDFHLSRTVSQAFLDCCIQRVNALDPDLVLLTGDYITYDPFGRFRKRLFTMLGRLRATHGVYACLGNHDYGLTGPGSGRCSFRLRDITCGLRKHGVVVLRNAARAVHLDGQALWLVGVGDLWAGDLRADRAFAKVPPQQPVIVLVHNPRAVDHFKDYVYGAVVSGHTHGRQIKWAGSGRYRRIRNRRYHAGLYDLDGGKLYVTRGLGRLGSLSFSARPEITVLRLI